MGFLSKLEKLSEKYIEGFFRQKFAGRLQPAEIAKKLAREMRDRRTVSVSHTYVPGEYTVFVSAADYENISAFAASLAGELAGFIAAKAAEKGYVLAGGPKVTVEADDALGLGQLRIDSKFGVPAEPQPRLETGQHAPGQGSAGRQAPETQGREISARAGQAPADGDSTLVTARDRLKKLPDPEADFDRTLTRMAAAQPKVMLVVKSGMRDAYTFPLGKHGITIGRRRTNDLCLPDTGISREHARLEYRDGSYWLIDLGSTNGTVVNGARTSSKKLEPGDAIRLGATWLEFRVV